MKKNKNISQLCSFLIILFLTSACNAQDSVNSSTDSKHVASTSPQIANHIFDIFEDSKGNLWFGTSKKGVAKYDGKSLTYYTEEDGLCGSSVANIAEDKEGNLWFGTHMDLCKYDPSAQQNGNKKFQTLARKDGVPILGWGWKTMGAGWKSVRTNNDRSIWVNSHHGMFHCDDPTLPIDQLSFTEFKVPMDTAIKGSHCNTPGKISLDLEDKNGNLWFGTDGDGIYKYDGKSFTHYNKEDGLLTNNVTNIVEDAQGNIWIACVESINPNRMNDGGLCMYNGKQFTTFSNVKGLSQNNIYTLYEDKSGNVWIGANGIGVYRYNASENIANEKRFTLYKEPKEANLESSVFTSGLQSVLEDSKGNMWFGYSGGLFRLEGSSIENVTVDGPWM